MTEPQRGRREERDQQEGEFRLIHRFLFLSDFVH